uniref:BED-type domain-containing protein n=1 Tax=Nelumbo nucifera TaxID=4432 RepID=A0A822Z102_NELNU|nr:TPA_asm: hypothetical protein HUJ06_008825 [Nelumbo nucifera]
MALNKLLRRIQMQLHKTRKKMNERADVWLHFIKFYTSDGPHKCKCNYCSQVCKCDPRLNGTSTLRGHLGRCPKCPFSNVNQPSSKQIELNFQASSKDQEGQSEIKGTLSTWKFDQNGIRKALAYMTIVDELPFKFVEGQGFRYICSNMQPRFYVPS